MLPHAAPVHGCAAGQRNFCLGGLGKSACVLNVINKIINLRTQKICPPIYIHVYRIIVIVLHSQLASE